MIKIHGVFMNTDNISESVERLEDSVILTIRRAFPHIDTLPEEERKVVMAAMAVYLADETSVELNVANSEEDRFEVSAVFIGRQIGKEINEVIPVKYEELARLYKHALMFKYRTVIYKESIYSDIVEKNQVFPTDFMQAIENKKALFITSYAALRK